MFGSLHDDMPINEKPQTNAYYTLSVFCIAVASHSLEVEAQEYESLVIFDSDSAKP